MKIRHRSVLRYYITALAAIALAFVLPLDTAVGFAIYCAVLAVAFVGGSFLPALSIEAAHAPTGDRVIDEATREGLAAIERMRAYNARIPGAEVSRRIDRLEELARGIFAFLKRHPEQLRIVRSFMDYTLPAALKLLDTYAELAEQPNKSANVTDTLRRIEGALEHIVTSFEGTLDKLYNDRALDIATDIDVLKGMLAREGFDNPFK